MSQPVAEAAVISEKVASRMSQYRIPRSLFWSQKTKVILAFYRYAITKYIYL
ncbi:hypothetical protein G7B40_015170 [Aetokthonos hydrillicola Thurmond2011]|uniref:Uncharacterized protein n=1 Tax=Aetokthonos hydrillicola Thurmond2011 TaxID=2712845 RepID=A0AAP5MAP9_9CYAN|nr:hypothetical protein [Aetokthonos hydrillicola]MDR9895894.1 hypothetical protein [Aetokthonos hydrillicola Thurmond2011]